MNINNKLKLCVISNLLLLVSSILIISLVGSKETDYWNYGPNDNLVIINIHINTLTKYYSLLIFIAVFKCLQVIISEIAHPIIGFNIYNPDKKVISDFTKFELQIYANTMYMIDSIRGVLMIMITITQIDIALFGALISEVTSIFTIRMLLNEKKFKSKYTQITNDDNDDDGDDDNLEIV